MNKWILIIPFVCLSLVDQALAADKASNCSKTIGIRSTREFLVRRNYRCFKSQVAARAAGFVDFGTVPTPTPVATATATATPTQTDFSGTWTTGSTPLARASASDTCDDVGITQAASLAVNVDVNHDTTSNIVNGEDNSDFGRSWGSASSNSFSLVDTIATSACGVPGRVRYTYAFSSISSDSANVTVTADVSCLGGSPFNCQQIWTGTATK